MISWVNAVCREWGKAQWYLMFGKNGFPRRTILGKLMEEGAVGAASNQYTREFPEVLVGENLIVANAVKTLPEYPRAIVSVHYVLRMPARDKYKFLEITRSCYYDTLSAAHVKLANAIEAQDRKILRKSVDFTIPAGVVSGLR